jgi:gamma-glutamylcysteine synthetase
MTMAKITTYPLISTPELQQVAICPFCDFKTVFRFMESFNGPHAIAATCTHAKAYYCNDDLTISVEFKESAR